MNESGLEQKIRDTVLARIESGKAHMHPRAYFAARIVLTGAVVILALALSAFVLSFAVFSIHESGEQFLLGFGTKGIVTFLQLFPWLSLVADVALLFLLEWLLQSFKFGYRVSLLSIFIAMFLTSTVLALLINLTPAHMLLLDRADRGQLPVIGELYEGVRDSHQDQGVFRGTVVSSAGPTSTIMHNDGDHDTDDGIHEVITASSTDVDAPIKPGDRIYIFGTESGSEIHAEGIRHLSDDQ